REGRQGERMSKLAIAAALATVVALGSAWSAEAQTYPSRPITMVVPFAAGGATDTFARLLSEQMRSAVGQTVGIENDTCAVCSIGVGRVARAAPDGHTLSIGTYTTHVLIGALYALPFDLLKDFEPIVMLASEPLLIVGRKNFPAGDLKELIAWL